MLALGGGGFTCGTGDAALDLLALDLASAAAPRICLLPTASGDQHAQVNAFYARYGGRACEPTHLSLFRLGARPVDVERHLLAQDVVYVGGGSLRNLLAIWRAHGLDRILLEAWRRGIVLAGVSAGAMCWFEGGVTTSGGVPAAAPALGLLRGSLSVHLDGEPARGPVFGAAVRAGELPPGWAVEDGVGLVFAGDRLERVVTSRPGGGALRVGADGTVTRVEAELLPGAAARAVPDDVLELRALRALRG